MSNSIDQHVVGLDFDTTKFDKGILKASEGLDKFSSKFKTSFENSDGSLKKAENALASFSQKISPITNAAKQGFSVISSSVSSMVSGIVDRLSTVATVAKYTFAGIGAAITGLTASGGLRRAMNLEQARFQLQGLDADVEAVMSNVNAAVKGTAYGLDAAAVVASQLTASGVQAGEGMEHSLQAVAGVAAMTGREYSEIGHIFTTVAGQGQLMTMQLRQLEYSGINAAASMAKVWGKTEEEVREMVHKGEVSFEDFSAAMYEAFGEHAKDANKIFTGAWANTKAALSRIGAKFATPGLEYARDILNAIMPLIDEVNEQMTPLVNLFTKWGKAGTLTIVDFLTDLTQKLKDTKAVSTALEVVANGLDRLISLGSRVGNFISSLIPDDFKDLSYWSEQIRTFGDAFGILADKLGLTAISFGSAKRINLNEFAKNFPIVEQFANVLNDIPNKLKIGRSFDDFKKILPGFSSEFDVMKNISKNANQMMSTLAGEQGFSGRIASLVHGFNQWAQSLEFTDDQIRAFNNLAHGFSNGLSSLHTLALGLFDGFVSAAGPALDYLVTSLLPGVINGLSGFFGSVEGYLPTAKELADMFRNIGKSIGDFFTSLKNGDNNAFDSIKNLFNSFVEVASNSGILEGLISIIEKLFSTIAGIKDLNAESVAGGLRALLDFIKSIPEKLLSAIPFEYISEVLSKVQFSFSDFGSVIIAVASAIAATDLLRIMKGVWKAIKVMPDILRQWLPAGIEWRIKNAFFIMTTSVKQFGMTVGRGITADAVKKVAVAIALLAGSLLVLSLIDAPQLAKSLSAVFVLLMMLQGFMSGMSKTLAGSGLMALANFGMVAGALISLGAAVILLSVAAVIFSRLDPLDLAKGLVSIAISVGIMVAAMDSFSTLEGPILRAAFSMMGLASVLLVMAGVVAIFGHMKVDTLVVGFTSVVVALGILIGALAIMNHFITGGSILKATFALAGIASALFGMAIVIKMLGSMSFDQLAVAFVALAGSLLVLGFALEGLGSIKFKDAAIAKAIASLGALTTVLLGMSIVIGIFSTIGLEGVLVGILGVIGSLGALTGALVALDKFVKADTILKSAFALTMVAGVLQTIAFAFSIMGNLSFDQLAVGFVGIGGGLIMMGLSMELMKKNLVGADAMVKAATALLILAPALVIISSIPILAVAVALGVIAGAFLAFSGISTIIAPTIPAILALAKSFLLIGAAALAISAGLTLAAVGISMLLAVGAPAITTFAATIVETAPACAQAFIAMGTAILDAITALIPQLAEVGISLVLALLMSIDTLLPAFVGTGISLIIQFAQGLIQAAPTLVSTGYQLLITLINSLANTIREQHEALYQAGKNLFLAVLEAMWDCLKNLGNDLGNFLMDLPAIISGQKPLFESAGTEMGDSLTNSASESMSSLGDIATEGINAVSGTFQNMDMSGIEGSFNAIPEALSTSMGEMGTIAEGGGMTFADSFIGSASSGLANSGFTDQIMASLGGMDTSSLGATKASEFIAPFQDTGPATAAGTGFGEAIASGAEPGMDKMVEGARTKSGEAISSVSGRTGEANNAGNAVGANLGSGIYSGMGAWMGAIANRAAEMVRNAKRAADNEAKSASPSKEMIKRGLWFGQGFEIGISKMIAPVSRMSADMVNEALGATEKYSLVMNSVNGLDWDMSPVIRPQLDLSEIEAGVAYMNSMLMTQGVINAAMSGSLVGADGTLLGASQPAGPVYNLYIDGAIVNSTPDIQRVIYETFEVVSAYGGMNHGN